jgi:hypothetical protein
MPVPEFRFVNGHRLIPPFLQGTRLALFAASVSGRGVENRF